MQSTITMFFIYLYFFPPIFHVFLPIFNYHVVSSLRTMMYVAFSFFRFTYFSTVFLILSIVTSSPFFFFCRASFISNFQSLCKEYSPSNLFSLTNFQLHYPATQKLYLGQTPDSHEQSGLIFGSGSGSFFFSPDSPKFSRNYPGAQKKTTNTKC